MNQDNFYFKRLPIDRYGRPMKLLLLSFINKQNNKLIEAKQIDFHTPIPAGIDGLVNTPVVFSNISGWDTDNPQLLQYKREFIADIIKGDMFIIHIPEGEVSDDNITIALLEQYGLFLDEGTFTLTMIDEDQEGDHYFTLTMLNEHLLLQGEATIRVVNTIQYENLSFSRLLDLREFYQDPHSKKYPTELYTKQMHLYANVEEAQWLYYLGTDMEKYSDISGILSRLTLDRWESRPEPSQFNASGYEVVYNGLRVAEYTETDPSYPYVVVIKLSEELCTNLEGCIQIGYRNDRKAYPGYIGGLEIRPVPIYRDNK